MATFRETHIPHKQLWDVHAQYNYSIPYLISKDSKSLLTLCKRDFTIELHKNGMERFFSVTAAQS